MDEPFVLEDIFKYVDFSRGHEKAVWDKIKSRLPDNPFHNGIDNIVGGSVCSGKNDNSSSNS